MTRYRHAPRLLTRIVDGEGFIISRHAIRNLSPAGTVMWLAFETPASKAEALALLVDVFPQASRRTLARDLTKLVASLSKQGLLRQLT